MFLFRGFGFLNCEALTSNPLCFVHWKTVLKTSLIEARWTSTIESYQDMGTLPHSELQKAIFLSRMKLSELRFGEEEKNLLCQLSNRDKLHKSPIFT